jgi:hypothetical protein
MLTGPQDDLNAKPCPTVPSPACGGGTGRGKAARHSRPAAPSPTLPRKRGREQAAGLTRRCLLGAAALLLARPARADDAAPLQFEQLYKSFGVRGLQFSDLALSLQDRPVFMRGYMAPPLKPESEFFVLTRQPLALCPFCQSDADWPVDIVVVYMKNASALVGAGEAVVVTGRLAIGSWTDPETGFVSQIRIIDAFFRRA